ncbi:unnamed protein product [Paramecium sonneborni]|uniref:NACHT domain-containing protein n=1 Tax=Paramecium sonneborni TaxID=65129 RepID=A0A8S1RFA3_9CILI|nr:unnamed protein product [Paramecium sonneborni]
MVETNFYEFYDDQIEKKMNQRESIISVFLYQNIKDQYQLRGGGCGSAKISNQESAKVPINFANLLKRYAITIEEKALTFQDKFQREDVLIAFLWFQNNRINFQSLCQDEKLCQQYLELLLFIIEKILKSSIQYLKVSGFLFHQLLQICNDSLRVLFSSQQKNNDRYLDQNKKTLFLGFIAEIETQIDIESQNIWMNGIKFELQMMKTCLSHCRTNSEKGKELFLGLLNGIVSSITSLQPSEELIQSLIEGAKFLLQNFYDQQIQHPLKKYEVYYFFENLKWQIIKQVQLGFSVQNIINQLEDGYIKYIKKSKEWMIHYCWISMISDLIRYRPIIHKDDIQKRSFNQKTKQHMWNQLIQDKIIEILPYDKNLARVRIFIGESSHLNLFSEIKLLQEYLLNENSFKMKLLPQYINFEFDNDENQKADYYDEIIQMLFNNQESEVINKLIYLLDLTNQKLKLSIIQIFQKIKKFYSQEKSSDIIIRILIQDTSLLIKSSKKLIMKIYYIFLELEVQFFKCREKNQELIKFLQFNQITIADEFTKNLQIYIDEDKKAEHQFYQNFLQILKVSLDFLDYLIFCKTKLSQAHNIQISKVEIEKKQSQINFLNLETYITNQCKLAQTINQSIQIFKLKIQKHLQAKEANFILNQNMNLDQFKHIFFSIYNPNVFRKILEEFNILFLQVQRNLRNDLDSQIQNTKTILFLILIKKFQRRLISIQKLKFYQLNEQLQNEIEELQNSQKKESNTDNVKKEISENVYNQIFLQQKMLSELFTNILNQTFEQIQKQKLIQKLNEDIQFFQSKYPHNPESKQFILLCETVKLKLTYFQQSNLQEETQNKILECYNSFLNKIKDSAQTESTISNSSVQQEENIKQILNIKQLNLSKLIVYFKDQINEIDQKMALLKQIFNLIVKFSNNAIENQNQQEQDYIQLIKTQEIDTIIELFTNLNIKKELDIKELLEFNNIVLDEDISNNSIKNQKPAKISELLTIEPFSVYLFLFDINLNITSLFEKNQEMQVDVDQTFQDLIIELNQDETQNQQQSVFNTLNVRDNISQNFIKQSYKVRECLVYNLIVIQNYVQENQIYLKTQQLIKQVWIQEKDSNVRSILKNQELLEMQKQLFSKDLKSFAFLIQKDFEKSRKKIEELEEVLLTEDNKGEIQSQIQQAYQDFENKLENIIDMSQKLDISLIFLKDISKDLKNLKAKMDKLLSQVNSIESDIRILRGKHFSELLRIRKQKVLRTKIENQIDQIHIELETQEYDPTSGKKREEKSMLFQKKFDDFSGEINEFLWEMKERKKDIMLIKGKAGSGKSRAAKNVEEYIWMNDQQEPNWIPIYISLPQIKYPQHNLIDQGLETENYKFDKIQIREFKEAIIKGILKVIFILDSYDEMKSELIESNLYLTNRFFQEYELLMTGTKMKFIITTREEILSSIGYQTWFYGSKLENLKEVELLPFNKNQTNEYIKQYITLSVKRTVKGYYEYYNQIQGKNFSYSEYQSIWSQLEPIFNKLRDLELNQNSRLQIFSEATVQIFISAIKKDNCLKNLNNKQLLSMQKELLSLWGEEQFQRTINNAQIRLLLTTPFMNEIMVQIIPKMAQQYSSAEVIKNTLMKNYKKLKLYQIESNEIRDLQEIQVTSFEAYQKNIQQQQLKNEYRMKKNQLDSDLKNIVRKLDDNNFFESFSISNIIDFLDKDTLISNQEVITLPNEAELISQALNYNQLTPYDFYCMFINYYHNQQLLKWRDQGQIRNLESMMIDIQDFSTYLALDMSLREISSINYKQKGKLDLQHTKDDGKQYGSWEDCYFNEHLSDSEYKQFIRKCSLIQSKGSNHSFNHKSIQEFFVAQYILQLFESIQLQKTDNQSLSVSNTDLKKIEKSFYNKDQFNISQDHYQGAITLLKEKLKHIENIKQKLIYYVQLSKQTTQYVFNRAASNSMQLLNILDEYLGDQNFNSIGLSDIKLNGLSFSGSDLSKTHFENVQIDACNFNNCKMIEVQWNNIICKEQPFIKAHDNQIIFFYLNNDETKIVTISEGILKIWNYDDDQNQLKILNEAKHNFKQVFSIYLFSKFNQIIFHYEINKPNKKYFSLQSTIKNSNEQFQIIISYLCDRYSISNEEQTIAFIINGELQLFKLDDLQNALKYPNNTIEEQNINSIAISFDQNILISGHLNGQITIWDISDLQNIKKIINTNENQNNDATIVELSEKSHLLATSSNQAVKIWHIDQSLNIKQKLWIEQFDQPLQMVFSISGDVFTLRMKNYITIYNKQYPLKQDKNKKIIKIPQEQIDCAAISPNSKMMATFSLNFLSIWNIESFDNIFKIKEFEFQNRQILFVLSFSPDGNYLAANGDNKIFIWNTKDFNLIRETNLIQNAQKEYFQGIIFSSDSKFLIFYYDNYLMYLEISKKGQRLFQLGITLNNVCMTKNDELTFCCTNQKIEIWNFHTFSIMKVLVFQNIQENDVLITFSLSDDDQEMICIFQSSNQIRFEIYQLNGSLEHTLKKSQSLMIEKTIQNLLITHIEGGIFVDYLNYILDSVFMPFEIKITIAGQAAFQITKNKEFCLIQNNKSCLIKVFEQNKCILFYESEDLAISKNEDLLAVATDQALLINLQTQKIVYSNQQKDFKCICICFSQNNELLGMGFSSQKILIYQIDDIDRIVEKYTILCNSDPICIRFSTDSNYLFVNQVNNINYFDLKNEQNFKVLLTNQSQAFGKQFVLEKQQKNLFCIQDNKICLLEVEKDSKISWIERLKQRDIICCHFSAVQPKILIIGSFYQQQIILQKFDIESKILVENIEIDIEYNCYGDILFNREETQIIISQGQILRLQDIKDKNKYLFSDKNNSNIKSFKFSTECQLIISKDANQNLQLWDIKTFKLLAVLNNYPFVISNFAITQKGTLIYSFDQMIKIWNIQDLKQQYSTGNGHKGEIKYLRVSNDGKVLLSYSKSKDLFKWNLNSLKEIENKSIELIDSPCFSHDDNYTLLRLDNKDCLIEKNNIFNSKSFKYRIGFTQCINLQLYLPSNILYSSHKDKSLIVWNFDVLYNYKPKDKEQLKCKKSKIIISPDCKYLVNMDEGLFNINDNKLTKFQFDDIIQSHCMVFSKDSNYLAIETVDNKIQILSLKTKTKTVIQMQERIRSDAMIFSSDNEYFFSFSSNFIQIWNWKNEQQPSQVFPLEKQFTEEQVLLGVVENQKNEISLIFFFPKLNSLQISIIQSQPYFAQVKSFKRQINKKVGNLLDHVQLEYCMQTNILAIQNLQNILLINFQNDIDYPLLEGSNVESQYTSQLSFTSDGKFLASIALDDTIRCWDLSNQKQFKLFVFSKQYQQLIALKFINNQQIIMVTNLLNIIIINIQEFKEMAKISLKKYYIEEFFFNKNKILYGLTKYTQKDLLLLLKIDSDEIIHQFKYNIDYLEFIDEHQFLYLEKGQIILVEIGKLQNSQSQFLIQEGVKRFFVSNDKQLIATTNSKQLSLWNIKTKEEKLNMDKFDCEIMEICITNCKDKLILGMNDGSIQVYNIHEQLLNQQINPVCIKVFSKGPPLMALNSQITGCSIKTKDKDLEQFFLQKGAIKK